MSRDWWVTWLIVIANPILAYGSVKFLGLEDTAQEYYIEQNMLAYYSLMILIECVSIKLLTKFEIAFITSVLNILLFSRALLHTLPLVVFFTIPHSTYGDEFISVWYYAIIQLLFSLQVFVFGISPIFDSGFHSDHERTV